jgi:hypothetical protein
VIAALLLALAGASATADQPSARATAAAPRRCNATRQLLIGNWLMDGSEEPPSELFPNGDAREWQFAVEAGRPVWREWMHYRPGSDGQWTLAGCRITMRFHGGGRDDFTIIRLTRTQLWLRLSDNRTVERWTRIPLSR